MEKDKQLFIAVLIIILAVIFSVVYYYLTKTQIKNTNDINYTLEPAPPEYSPEEIRIAEYVGNAWIDILNYTQIHNDDLTTQLRKVDNGTADRLVDDVLQQKVNNLHNYLTQNISATTLVKIGADEVLWMVYNLDDLFNPKNVTQIAINTNRTPEITEVNNA